MLEMGVVWELKAVLVYLGIIGIVPFLDTWTFYAIKDLLGKS